jgi:hypothetical protein
MLKAADIKDNDTDFLEIRKAITWDARALRHLTAPGQGPIGPTKAYEAIEGGQLVAHYAGNSRIVFAADWARYLTILRRESVGKEEKRREIARARQLTEKAREGHRRARLTRASKVPQHAIA